MTQSETLLVGDRSERYELPIVARRAIYVRPGIHPDPDLRPMAPWRVAAIWLVPMIVGWSLIIRCAFALADVVRSHLH